MFYSVAIEDGSVYFLGGMGSRSIFTLMVGSFFELYEFRRGKRVVGIR